MDKKYEIFDFNHDTLLGIFKNSPLANPELIEAKRHLQYFEEYLDHLGAKTVVTERDYVDHDFLGDFAGYYVSCFQSYKRKCDRLHFFNLSFTENSFISFLNGSPSDVNIEILDKSYLGFLIIKPLPFTKIGRTCLATYDSDSGRRFFPVIREYEANLFGIPLTVNSLAYQEQDTVVAACATSALWSVFNGTGRLFQHQILSPVEITNIACSNIPLESRYFPNPGLSPAQMAQAIRKVNLEPYLIQAEKLEALKFTMYAYMNIGTPLLLGMVLADVSKPKDGRASIVGHHAVAITGYSLGHDSVAPSEFGLRSRASRIDKIYVHDDQIGPFSKMIFNSETISCIDDQGRCLQGENLDTSYIGADKKKGSVKAIPTILLVPLYKKIRIPYSTIHDIVADFDSVIKKISHHFPLLGELEWDIYLTTINKIKTGMLSSRKWRNAVREQVLLSNMPKFIWRATAFDEKEYILDFLFDATDIEQGSLVSNIIGYREEVHAFLMAVASSPEFFSKVKFRPCWRIFEFLKKSNTE